MEPKSPVFLNRNVGRRRFLQGGAAVVAGALAAPFGLEGLVARGSLAEASRDGDSGYGPLAPAADLRDGVSRIALPEGFQYRSFGVAGTEMSDGNLTPLAHDGMAAYVGRYGQVRLVRNHEDRNGPGAGSTGGSESKRYDTLAGGGTTTLSINPRTRKLVKDFVSLNGTTVNCAGGLTPWNSWLTCEETTDGVEDGWEKPHGYVFDVPAFDNRITKAVAFPQMGRFDHEAVAVDPNTWIVYETEDAGSDSGFYRYEAKRRGRLQEGKLQMLAIDGAPNYDTRTGQKVGAKLKVKWVDVPNPDPKLEAGEATCFEQGFANKGARFARLEGCWYGNGSVFIVSTSGGAAGQGQVWEYEPDRRSGGTLKLIFESPGAAVLNAPDNITVTPNGGLLLCEDGSGDQYLRGLTRRGEIFDFALNLEGTSEWAGATFAVTSGDGDDDDDDRRHSRDKDWGWWWQDDGRDRDRNGRRTTLFVNRQGATGGANPPASDPGMTFAIWGPWHKGAL